MEKIDFAGFNKPKHFPMWLCDGDTLKLAEYDDAQLEELDKNTRSIADQYGIDSAVGAELDRIGKILGEDRGGNSDKVYRIYLKLKTMLNTANGTIEDIIRFVKFFYSSETVRLVPNYPAGIRILHDGENPTLDFNRIIKQIVGSGIFYDTRELFNMTEELPFSDEDDKTVRRSDGEFFARGTVYRDGRVLREGTVVQPVYRNSGISDPLVMAGSGLYASEEWSIGEDMRAGIRYAYFRDGLRKRNGSITRKGDVLISV